MRVLTVAPRSIGAYTCWERVGQSWSGLPKLVITSHITSLTLQHTMLAVASFPATAPRFHSSIRLRLLPSTTRQLARRCYATAGSRPKSHKVYDNVDEAVADVKSGDILLSGGFGLCGTPDTLIQALSRRPEVKKLTGVSNNAGVGKKGLGERTLGYQRARRSTC